MNEIEDLKREIIKIIKKISDVKILRIIYQFVKVYK